MQDNQRQALQYAYIAGLIDGEGCLRINKALSPGLIKQKHKNPQYSVSISIHMTDRKPLDYFRSVFPKGYMAYEGVRENRPNQQPTYCWRCQSREQVLDVIEKLYPYLIVKKKQADLLRDYCIGYVDLRNMGPMNNPNKIRELQRREDLYLRMKKLNSVGAAATTNSRSTREREVIV